MRLSGTKTGAINQYRGLGNQLWDLAGNRPSLDLPFSDTKSLVDATTSTNLIDFTRASSGTYVGSDGLIKTATTNLLSWSEDFTNAVWQTTNPGEVTLTTGVADPFGGTSATTLFHDSGAGDTGWLRRLNTGTTGLSYTLSFWIRRRSGTGNFVTVVGDNINQIISGITSEWQRVSVSNVLTSTTLRTYFKVDSAGDEFDIFGAQLEQSSTVGEYVKTTSTINSAPRFDHDPTTGESLGLLVEEQRVNNVLQSEAVSTSPWGILGNPTITPNNAISPRGDSTADLVAGDGVQVFSGVQQVLSSLVIGNTYVVSSFIKPNDATTTRLGFYNQATPDWNFYIDISWSSGVPSTSAQFGSPTNIQYQNYGNGWYRCSFVGTVDTTTPQLIFQPDRLNVGASVWIWGVSVESGTAGASVSFPTSYIPTEGTTVTRAADVTSISGSNFSSWFNYEQSTALIEFEKTFAGAFSAFGSIFEVSDGTGTNKTSFLNRQGGTAFIYSFSSVSGSNLLTYASYNVSTPASYKYALAIATNSARSAGGGQLLGSVDDTSVSVSNLVNQAQIQAVDSIHIKRLTYWPARLPNSTLQTITQ